MLYPHFTSLGNAENTHGQIALCAGARVILTSSSSAKLERAKTLLQPLARNAAADVIQTINYSEIQDWDKEAIRLNKGKPVDFVIEIGGRGTIARSIRSTRQGGLVAVSGYMSDYGKIDDAILREGALSLIGAEVDGGAELIAQTSPRRSSTLPPMSAASLCATGKSSRRW
jgi:NADPH:quinone reductase-like Zn-dependent oxidoreductase